MLLLIIWTIFLIAYKRLYVCTLTFPVPAFDGACHNRLKSYTSWNNWEWLITNMQKR